MYHPILKLFGVALLVSGFCVLPATGLLAADTFTLTVLHTNDVHSRYEPIDRNAVQCDPTTTGNASCFVPAARLAMAVEMARERSTNTILLDAGDQFPPPVFPVPAAIGRPFAAELMNLMGYDAMTLGNHDFDDGPEVLVAFLDALDFPVLTTSERVLSDKVYSGLTSPTAALEIGEEKIGLIGLGAPDPLGPDPETVAQDYADQLSSAGINKIIAISHLGYETDKRIAANTSGLDVIVGGHSHTRLANTPLAKKLGMTYPTMVNNVAIVHAFMYGTFLGELRITFDQSGAITATWGDLIPMDTVVDNQEVRTLVEDMVVKIEAANR